MRDPAQDAENSPPYQDRRLKWTGVDHMVSLQNGILTRPIEPDCVRKIGVLVIGPPFRILYVNEHAQRIIGRLRAGTSGGQRGLPVEIMTFCRDAGDMLAATRRRDLTTVHPCRTVASATTSLRLRATVMPAGAADFPSHMLIAIEEIPLNRNCLEPAAKRLSLCSRDHEPKSYF
jgi:hypothetical protein